MNYKHLFTILAVLFLQFTAHSQIEAGILTGINYSTQQLSEDLGSMRLHPRLDLFGGAALQYNVNNKWRLSSNFLYSREGYKSQNEINLQSQEYRFSYVSWISEGEYRLLPFLTIGAGANISGLASNDVKFNSGEWYNRVSVRLVKKADLRLTGKIKLEYRGFYTFARYNLGVVDISNITYTDDSGTPVDIQEYSRNLQFGLGYMMKLSK